MGRKNLGPFFIRRSTMATIYTIVTYHKIKPNNTRLCRSAILRSGPLLYIKTTVASPCYGRTKSLWSGPRLLYHHGWSSGLAISRCTGYSFVNPIRADPTLIYDAQFLTVGSVSAMSAVTVVGYCERACGTDSTWLDQYIEIFFTCILFAVYHDM
ncbi:hypothetical protein ARMGADRAFT_482846 [Armillaria gallica]|uniref:Uncharacterized protein n=1 Tax=Armillaria gallica TaxID=47427 RepID=A0A2H3EHZ6_ARMGA|nr:hypothetical protein ARMGADRAFT_482846 [Armillaria gallica]